MINYRVIQDAIRNWALYISGLADDRIYWKSQNGNRIIPDHIVISLGEIIPLGIDALTDSTDLGRPAGQEVQLQTEGDRDFGVRLEMSTSATASELDARSVLAGMQTRAGLPSARQILLDAEISPYDEGQITYLPAIDEALFQGRGVWDLRMYVRDSATENTGYIAKVIAVDNATGDVIEIST